MRIIFCIAILALATYAVAGIIRQMKYSFIVRTAACGVAVAASLIAGIADASLTSVGIGVAVCAALSYVLGLLSDRIGSQGLKAFVLYAAKALAVLLVLEAVVFNFNTYHLWRGGYETAELNLQTAQITGMSRSGDGYVSTGDSAVVEFTGIDQRIGTIRADVTPAKYKVDYSIDFTDETNASYYIRSGLVKGSVYRDIEATSTIVCDFSGAVGKLRITFSDLDENPITLRGFTLNTDYPSHFSYLRVLLILMGVMFVWLFRRSVTFGAPIGDRMNTVKFITVLVVLAAVLIAVVLGSVEMNPSTDFRLTTGNQMTKELVDAFEAGQAELQEQPNQQLLSMENPYDWSARSEQGVTALWDHVLYEGKYYSYYGVGPVILLFLPYHLLTGFYFPSALAVTIFNVIALLFIGMTFYLLMKKFFSDIPLSMYTGALMMLFAACGVWYCTIHVNFYEIAQSSGFCFTALGAYFLISTNVIGDGKIRPSRAALSSLFLAIAVSCRPTTVIWCFVAVVFIAVGVLKLRREEKPAPRRCAVYLVCALAPFAVIGGMLMIYNHARFGSFTDFGIDYSLTINDFTHTEFHTQLAAIGFFDYLLAAPTFSGEFPYIHTTLSTLGVNGYYFVATNNGVGLLFRALPMFFLFASPFALKYVEKERRIRAAVLFASVAFVAPFIIIASIWESGYGVRYMMDFAWEMLVCALFVMFLFYRSFSGREAKRIYEHFMLISVFASIAVCVALTYSYYCPGPYIAGYETIFERFARMFSIFNT